MLEQTLSPMPKSADLLLQIERHRRINELQLILSLIAMQARKARQEEARELIFDLEERVAIIASQNLYDTEEQDLGEALGRSCKTLNALSHDVQVVLTLDGNMPALRSNLMLPLVLAVNELAMNAIKHAFGGDFPRGFVHITVTCPDDRRLTVAVEDDGAPFDAGASPSEGPKGLGLELVRRLVASRGGLFIPPERGSKRFELRFQLTE